MNKPKVSIIVPIYKVETFIHECVDSIINQTLREIEIILVDDGSPDRCPEICDEYAAKDNRVKVIHKENGGYGTACNRGIAEARGDYIGLVESDDWIEPTMYEKLYNKITQFDAEVCIGSFYEYKSLSKFPNGKNDRPYKETIDNIDDSRLFSIMENPFLYTVHPSVWSKLYKSDFIKGIKFDETPKTSYQDGPFITEVYCKAKKIIGLKDFLYHYRVDNEYASSGNARRDKKLLQILDSWKIAENILKKYGMFNDLKEEFFYQVSKSGFRFYKNIDNKYKKEFFDKWKEFVKEIKNDDTYSFKYLNDFRRNKMESVLKDDFRASLFDEYKAKKLFGIPILEKTVRDGKEKRRLFGIPYSSVETVEGNLIKKKLFGLVKKTQDKTGNRKYYLLGMRIYKKSSDGNLDEQSFNRMMNNSNSIRSFFYYTHLASVTHSLIFLKYKDINIDKDVVLFACGPSAKYYSKIENAYHVGVNRALYNDKINFQTLFMHDKEFVIENIEFLKNYNADKFCAFHILGNNARTFNVSSECIAYIKAKRFFISDPSYKNIDDNVPDVINPDITSGMLYDRGGGTVFSALQFILYTRPKRIFLVGCDCTESGYFYSACNNKQVVPSHWKDPREGKNILLPNTIKLWHEFNAIVQMLYQDIKVISINPVGLKGLFKDVYTPEYLEDNPYIEGELLSDYLSK